ncbi:hypothetical protein BASA83_002074 [Batrachochytrium salamandrivorans]|nr:hypothetical protein BASA83_002074 [Batrachochytrium salamandrivorans]
MVDPLLWVLHHFVIYYAGQTTQGNKDDGDDDNQASGSNHNPKQDTDLPLKVHPINLSGFLRKTKAPDQNGASSSADPQPKKECKGGNWLRKYPSRVHSNNHHQNCDHPLRMISPNPMKCYFLFVWENQR